MVRSATSGATSGGATSGEATTRQLTTGRVWLLGLVALGLLTWGSFQAGALLTRSEPSVVHVSPAAFETARVEGPHPRIEVWDAPGRLLLLRSVPQTASEDDVFEEVSSARSFTRPLESDA